MRQREKTRCILRKGGKIYGVGSTVVLAIVDAKDCTSEEDYHEISPDIYDDDLPNIWEVADGALCWAACTDRLAGYFETNRTQDIYRLDKPTHYLDFNEKYLTLLNLSE